MKCRVLEKSVVPRSDGIHVLVDEGTIIGDGTDYPLPKGTQKGKSREHRGKLIPAYIPGSNLEPLDDEARAAAKFAPPPLSLNDMPLTPEEAEGTKAKGVAIA